jgi:TPR repeat protein
LLLQCGSMGAASSSGWAYPRSRMPVPLGCGRLQRRAYASGYGVELSARDSTEWLQRAARAGDAEAMYGLSLAMTLGFGTDVDAGAAQEWLKTAEGATRKRD